MKKYLTTGEAAEYIGCSKATLVNYETTHGLRPAMVLPSGARRYTKEGLDEFFDRYTAMYFKGKEG